MVTASLALGSTAVRAQQEVPATAQDADGEPGWIVVGTFRGATTLGLIQQLNDLVFEQENDGTLFRDVGDIKLGISLDIGNVDAEWDNYFSRRVQPQHGAIRPGDELTGEDLSTYTDIDRIVTRGRFTYEYLPDFINENTGIGVQVEGGYSLQLIHSHEPQNFSDRPLGESLPRRYEGQMADFTQQYGVSQKKSVLYGATVGVAALADWIGDSIGSTVADTERSAIFFEHYADPITLFIDLGLPVESDLFTASDTRLNVGDETTFITFLGISPIVVGLRNNVLRASYRRFYRVIRKTTIQKQADNHVLVRVGNELWKGNEIIPIKLRPEVRVLGVLKIGYTFFELIYDNAKNATSEIVYRIDLGTPEGMDGFRKLIGDSTRVELRPLLDTARAGEGAEILATEFATGNQNELRQRARLFSLYRRTDYQAASSQVVETDSYRFQEIVRSRSRNMRKTLGTDRDMSVRVAITAQGDIEEIEQVSTMVEQSAEGTSATVPVGLQGVSALQVDNAITGNGVDGTEVRRRVAVLEQILDRSEPEPQLDSLKAMDDAAATRMFLSLRLSFGYEQLVRMASANDEELWIELATLLLGPEYRNAWSTPQLRGHWLAGSTLPDGRHISDLYDAHRGLTTASLTDLGLTARRPDCRALFIRASRMAKRFKKLRRLLIDEDCFECVVSLFSRWRDITPLQMLMVRFGGGVDTGGVGYSYRVFTVDMARPVSGSNDVTHVLPHGSRFADLSAGERWIGTVDEIPAASDRLRGGRLLLRLNPEASEAAGSRVENAQVADTETTRAERKQVPCFRLRVFSDLLFADDLALRVDLRNAARLDADVTLMTGVFEIDEPIRVVETPFSTAKYFYEIDLPIVPSFDLVGPHTFLFRVLNADGLPVTEEQQVRFELPPSWKSKAPGHCVSRTPPTSLAALRAPSRVRLVP